MEWFRAAAYVALRCELRSLIVMLDGSVHCWCGQCLKAAEVKYIIVMCLALALPHRTARHSLHVSLYSYCNNVRLRIYLRDNRFVQQ